MPHIRFRSLQSHHVSQLSVELTPALASAIQTSEDNFTFELIQTQYFIHGQPTSSYPFVEVLWFARSQEVQDRCALLITEKVKALSKAEDVVVVFTVLEKTAYYENGTHF